MEVNFGIFTFNIQELDKFFSQPIFDIVIQLMAIFGWLVFFWMLLYVALEFYQEYRENKFTVDWKWVVLAIDVPALNIQTPKAVEQMFAHLAGGFDKPNIAEKFHDGYKQRWFSLEIISIEGYIQFLIRTEEKFRDLVEASVYAQYPDAEIVEVEDYVTNIPDEYPNETHDIWAADFTLTEGDASPIRTYREFEHSISKDTVLKDPMGTFLESFSRLGPGEQMWFQIIIEPISNSWKEKSIETIKEMIGEASGGGNTVVDMIFNAPLKALEQIGDQVFGREASSSSGDEKPKEPNLIRYLTPGKMKIVEAMEEKISKIGFKTKMRGVYLARKEVFRPERGVNLLIGAVNQFNIPSANSLAPTYGISASYFGKSWRTAYKKKLLMKAYKKRKIKVGANPFIFNIEELATVWHFPMSHVKTPLVQKTEAKQAEPPIGLPIEAVLAPVAEVSVVEEKNSGYRTDAGDVGGGGGVKFG